jgi:hypothetical protein
MGMNVLPSANGRPALSRQSLHRETAATAVLCSKRPGGGRLTVLYSGQQVQVDLACRGRTLWSGPWHLDVRLDSAPAEPASSWEATCWVSDADVDYLELEVELGLGLRVQRHIALAREDGFLLLADAVLGERSGRLEYRGRLPLAPGVTFRPAKDTREGTLRHKTGPMARVMPLALPEWRGDAHMGELVSTSPHLELRQGAERRRLFAPLFFDLDARRLKRRFTWRQLSVAQSMQGCPADMAVGYRVAVGKEQWLIYRSLGETGNRTVLGHNLSTETLLARFDKSGEVESLVEIE